MDGQDLTNLLQCSYCNEKMDEKSQVLPCQHTFCTKCLNIVVEQKGHLQCPECNVEYRELDVENLPKNIFLLRLLEQINNTKNTKRNVVDSSESLTNENPIPNRDNIKPKDAVKRLSDKVEIYILDFKHHN